MYINFTNHTNDITRTAVCQVFVSVAKKGEYKKTVTDCDEKPRNIFVSGAYMRGQTPSVFINAY